MAYPSPRGAGYTVASAISGNIAATTAALSTLFAVRNAPPPNTKTIRVVRFNIRVVTGTVFGTATVVRGRRLIFKRGSGAAPTGGTGIAAAGRKMSSSLASQADSASGGDIRIATTGALSTTGIAFEAGEVLPALYCETGGAANTPLTGGFGGVTLITGLGDVLEAESTYAPVSLRPGELLAVQNATQFDAASGDFVIEVDLDFLESGASS